MVEHGDMPTGQLKGGGVVLESGRRETAGEERMERQKKRERRGLS